MSTYFAWLVRHERLVAAISLILIIALALQLKFCTPDLEPGRDQPQVNQGSPGVGSAEHNQRFDPGTDLTGEWEMSVRKRNGGTQTWTLTLQQQGEALSGVLNSEGGDLPVSGTVQGPSVNLSAQRFGVTVKFPASFDGTTMTGTMRVLSITRQWTAKRK
jgi:hypothetical protein